jgi:hypothetical protein
MQQNLEPRFPPLLFLGYFHCLLVITHIACCVTESPVAALDMLAASNATSCDDLDFDDGMFLSPYLATNEQKSVSTIIQRVSHVTMLLLL